jgi:hypothetical protein
MAYGVGGGGILGIALERLAAPVQATATSSTSGGTLPTASTYKYVVTATNQYGETGVSNEQTITTGAGSTNSNTVNWASVSGATGYKIYRTAAGGGTGTELFLASVGAVTSYLDTGSGTPAGAQPTFNSANNPGVYTAPTKFIPFNSESLKYMQDTNFRRPIRASVDVLNAVPGNVHTEGDLEMDGREDVMPYFMYASRMTVVRSGSNPNWIYTGTPNPNATPQMTMSITIVRDGIVFGYVGCVVSQWKLSISDGTLIYSPSILGLDEAVQSTPVATWPTSVPFGAGQYHIEVPSGTQVFDTDTFELTVNDNGVPEFRLKDTGRGAQFIRFGERSVELSLDRDFQDRTDYDAFKALTAQDIKLTATKGTNNSILAEVITAIKDTYEVALSGQGDLVRASIAYQGILDPGTGNAYQMVVKTQETVS